MSVICYYARCGRWDIVLKLAEDYPCCIWDAEDIFFYDYWNENRIKMPLIAYPILSGQPGVLHQLLTIAENYLRELPMADQRQKRLLLYRQTVQINCYGDYNLLELSWCNSLPCSMVLFRFIKDHFGDLQLHFLWPGSIRYQCCYTVRSKRQMHRFSPTPYRSSDHYIQGRCYVSLDQDYGFFKPFLELYCRYQCSYSIPVEMFSHAELDSDQYAKLCLQHPFLLKQIQIWKEKRDGSYSNRGLSKYFSYRLLIRNCLRREIQLLENLVPRFSPDSLLANVFHIIKENSKLYLLKLDQIKYQIRLDQIRSEQIRLDQIRLDQIRSD